MRFGTVALVGRTNVGKSTFLNGALGEALAITSPLPQTTRDALLGVAHHGDAQIAFLDTPGIHRPKSELGRRMNDVALDAARRADVVILITDVWDKSPARSVPEAAQGTLDPSNPWLRPGDTDLVERTRRETQAPLLLVVNKVDRLRDKTQLLPMLEAYDRLGAFRELIPASVKQPADVQAVLGRVRELLPEAPPAFEKDTLTDRPILFFVREYVREAILNQLQKEVPHAVAVSIDLAEESPALLRVQATIHVEKLGQRKILIGKGGAQIKAIGTSARQRIETLVGKKVYLELFVRITEEWKNTPRQLAELGYEVAQVAPSLGTGLATDVTDALASSAEERKPT